MESGGTVRTAEGLIVPVMLERVLATPHRRAVPSWYTAQVRPALSSWFHTVGGPFRDGSITGHDLVLRTRIPPRR